MCSVVASFQESSGEEDNRHLLSVEQVAENRSKVKEWDTVSGRFRVVADVKLNRPNSSSQEPQVIPLRLSSDGKLLFLRMSEISGTDVTSPVRILNSVRSLDLTSSKVETVVQVDGSSGLD